MGDTTTTDTSASTPSEQTNQQPASPAPAAAPATPPQPPAPAATPAATPPAASPAASPAAPDQDTKYPWLSERLQRAGQTAINGLLKQFGAANEAELKAKLDKLSQLERDSMTEAERRQAEIEELKPVAAKVQQYATIMQARVVAELAELNDEQRAAVEALGGDDPAEQLRTIDALKPTWAKQGAQTPPAEATPPAAPPAQPPAPAADTAPARASAPGETHDSPPNHKAIWDGLKQSNPFAASAYYRQHAADINKGLIPSES